MGLCGLGKVLGVLKLCYSRSGVVWEALTGSVAPRSAAHRLLR